ncbi:MAG TPA: hypothetical protein VKV04_04660, partial [Verrucomicrobiae bacterium]|nr:hypothetical protein [Verrucomicrobiae bacterium]
RPHVGLRKRLLLAFAVLSVAAISTIGYSLYQILHYKIPESYAAWTTGNLMVEYLQTHANRWPRSWEDLQSATNSLLEKGMPVYMPLTQLHEFVKIDWQADPGRLLQAASNDSNFTIRVVTRLDGSKLLAMWGPDTEPNTKIIRYLESTLTASNTSRTAAEP